MQTKTNNPPEMFGNLVAQALTETFHRCCTSALEATVVPGKSEPLAADQQSAWFGINFEGSVRGRALIAVKRADIPALDLRDSTDTQTEATALLSMLQTLASRLQELATRPYGALVVSMDQAADPALPNSTILGIQAKSEEGDIRATLNLCLEPQLMCGLERLAGVLFPDAEPGLEPRSENLGLVMDVELNATLRFGQRQLSLREILDLTSGSVVELDRQIDEPVELVLDDRVIARGEAVIIDGNYGMRITEIVHPVNGIARSR